MIGPVNTVVRMLNDEPVTDDEARLDESEWVNTDCPIDCAHGCLTKLIAAGMPYYPQWEITGSGSFELPT